MADGRLQIDLPDGWFRIDLDPGTVAAASDRLVDSWIERRPQLAEHRATLVDALVRTSRHARDTHCVMAAASFGDQAGVGPSYAGLVARILAWPGRMDTGTFLSGMAGAARGDAGVSSAEVVRIGGRQVVLVRQRVAAEERGTGEGAAEGAVTTFVVPVPERGVFLNLEFSSPVAPAPEHTFAPLVATARVA